MITQKLQDTAHAVDKLRTDLLFDEAFDDSGAMDEAARLEFLQGLAVMDQAVWLLRRAALSQVRALAAEPRSRM